MPRSRSAWASLGLVICSETRSTPPSCSDTRRSLVGDGVGIAEEERAVRAAGGVELRPRRGGEAALPRDLAEHLVPARVDRVGGGSDAVADVAEDVQPDLEVSRRVAGLRAGPAVEVDERREPARFAADDRDHQRQAEQAGPHERFRRAPDADPDRQRVLRRARVDALPGQGGAVPARPGDVHRVADLQQQVELLGEQRVVVVEVEPEQRERLGERSAPDDEVDASLGDQVERGELLEHPDRVGGAEHGHRAAQPDPRRARGRGTEDHRRRRVVVLRAVVLADPERVQARGVRERDLLQQVLDALLGPDHPLGRGIGDRGDETVDADVHVCSGLNVRSRWMRRLPSRASGRCCTCTLTRGVPGSGTADRCSARTGGRCPADPRPPRSTPRVPGR